jgi:hypothetical protein
MESGPWLPSECNRRMRDTPSVQETLAQASEHLTLTAEVINR